MTAGRLPLILALAAAAAACRDSAACEALIAYEPVRAETDAQRAFAAGDRALYEVYGYTSWVPGTDSGGAAQQASRLPVRGIEGTTDSPESARCAALDERAKRYAERYNRRILELAADTARRERRQPR